jgi:putative transposase
MQADGNGPFYFLLRTDPCSRRTAIVTTITGICDEFECYGWRRVQAALRQQGLVVYHKKVRRLMREQALQPRMRRRFTTTTDSDHDQPIFPLTAPTSFGSPISPTPPS